MVKENIVNQIGKINSALDGLTDEVIESGNGAGMLVHHIDGNPNNKLVLGTIRKGKSRLPIHALVGGSSKPSVDFKVNDLVNFHETCGGEVTSTGHVITNIHLMPNNFGVDVAWITNKSGCVSLQALSKVEEGILFIAGETGSGKTKLPEFIS